MNYVTFKFHENCKKLRSVGTAFDIHCGRLQQTPANDHLAYFSAVMNSLVDQELVDGLLSFSSLLQRKLPAIQYQTETVREESPVVSGVARICPEWKENIKCILFSEEMIARKVKEMAARISHDYIGKSILVVGLLKGAFIFAADLLRWLTVPYHIDFMVISSYEGTESGNLKLKQDISVDPANKHILVVEDLIDTGKTLEFLKRHLLTKNPASVKMCCLLDKKSRRESDVQIDYVGWECPDEFVVGYGMDFNGGYRCMPFVGVLKSEAYAPSKSK